MMYGTIYSVNFVPNENIGNQSSIVMTTFTMSKIVILTVNSLVFQYIDNMSQLVQHLTDTSAI